MHEILCFQLSNESFGRKPYFSELDLPSVRYRFRISSKMVDVRANFSRKFKSRPSGITCPSCKQTNSNGDHIESPPESQEHIERECEAFNDIRNQYDLSDDRQLVLFFQDALAQRDQRMVDDDSDDNDY